MTDWATRARALRQRLALKQAAMAQLIGVSQTYISRLESGLVRPSQPLIDAIARLTRNPRTRSPFDDILALVEHSPFACFVVRPAPASGVYPLEAVSGPMRETYSGDAADLGACDTLAELRAHVDAICEAGLFDGRVATARGPWQAPGAPDRMREVHYVPIGDGSGGSLVHGCVTDTAEIDALEIRFVDEDSGAPA